MRQSPKAGRKSISLGVVDGLGSTSVTCQCVTGDSSELWLLCAALHPSQTARSLGPDLSSLSSHRLKLRPSLDARCIRDLHHAPRCHLTSRYRASARKKKRPTGYPGQSWARGGSYSGCLGRQGRAEGSVKSLCSTPTPPRSTGHTRLAHTKRMAGKAMTTG